MVPLRYQCSTCKGYGMWADEEDMPVLHNEAKFGMYTKPCPECDSDNSFYENEEDESDKEEYTDDSSLDFFGQIAKFQEHLRCVELPVMLEKEMAQK